MNNVTPAGFLLRALLLLTGGWALVAHGADANWDARLLERILAESAPGARLIRVGDMLLPRAYVEAARDRAAGQPPAPHPDSAFAGTLTLWPGGVVPYDFAADVSPEHQRAFVDAARDWSAFANVSFVRRTSQADYVFVQNMPSGGGFSAVGKVGGPQDFKIGPFAWNRGTLSHELGHVLGMVHEHQRSDRDSYVTINVANLPFGLDGNFVKLTDSNNQGAYDFDSIMHYAKNTSAIDPAQNTIDPLPPYAQHLNTMGNHFDRTLSVLDRQKMAVIYGPGPPQTGVVTNTQDSGPGSLRAAIYYAVDHPGTTITFNLPTSDPGFANSIFTIQPSDVMTTPGAGTTIDGTTQPSSNPNGPSVQLSGLFAQASDFFMSGLRLTEANCSARGLLLTGFTNFGIEITGPGATGNTVAGCYLGTNSAATGSVPNAYGGVGIKLGAHHNTIGGTTTAARNIISGGATQGVFIGGPGTNSNVVSGNYIGLDRTGTMALPNADCGVGIFDGAQGNVIGGLTASARNVISGNTQQGIVIRDIGTSGNVVMGNFVGTNPTGTAALSNGNGGVAVFSGATANTIGGTLSGAGNVVSGNTGDGIFVGYAGTNQNNVQGNLVGVDASGNIALPNTGAGIDLYFGAQSNLIGGTISGAGNLISGNAGSGVFIGYEGSDHNVVQGNIIGLNRAGTAAVPNAGDGLVVYLGPQDNLIGGTNSAARNVISGNTFSGVVVSGAGTTQNVVRGNYLGLNAAGTAPIGNQGTGAVIGDSHQNTIGPGNIISGNSSVGIALVQSFNNLVIGNFVGTDPAGSAAFGNHSGGIALYFAANANRIGGSGVGMGNLVSGNLGDGVTVIDNGTNNNVIQGNWIGVDNSGSNPLPNSGSGIRIYFGAQSNLFGGPNIGAGNLISGNGSSGISLSDSTTVGNTFRQNSIFNNQGFGIALLTNPKPQVAPVLSSAQAGLGTAINGALNSTVNATFRIEFFATPLGDPFSVANGQYFLGETMTTTNGAGVATFSVVLPPAVPAGYLVTCTATNAIGSTSEFSNAVTVAPPMSTLNDGIPDAWKTLYGFSVNDPSVAGADTDGTGLTNLQKYKAGLNPLNPKSFLRITSVVRLGADLQLTFPSVNGIIYRLERCTNLSTGGWTMLIDQIVGTGAPLSITDPQAALQPQVFYRVSVLP